MSDDVLPPEPHKIRFRMPYDHPSPEFVAGLRCLGDYRRPGFSTDLFGLAERAGVTPETLLGWYCTRVPTFEQMLVLCEEVFLVRVSSFWEIGAEEYDAETEDYRAAVRVALAGQAVDDPIPDRFLPAEVAEAKMAEWSAPYREEAVRILADVRALGTLSFSTLQGARITLTAERKPGRGRGYSYRYTLHLPSYWADMQVVNRMRPVDLGRKMTAGAVLDALTAQLQVSAYDAARESPSEAVRSQIPLFVDLGFVDPSGNSGAPLFAGAVEP